MSLDKALKNVRFDKRLVEIHVQRGLVTREEVEAHLKALPDLSDRVEKMKFTETMDSEASTH